MFDEIWFLYEKTTAGRIETIMISNKDPQFKQIRSKPTLYKLPKREVDLLLNLEEIVDLHVKSLTTWKKKRTYYMETFYKEGINGM